MPDTPVRDVITRDKIPQDKIGNLRRFPLERSAAADALRHIADLLELGEIESAAGVFMASEDWSEFTYFPENASVTRLIGGLTLIQKRIMEAAEEEEEEG